MTISDKVGALDCMHDQKIVILNDQGGERMDVTKDKTCTLRAEAHHPPVVVLDRAAFNQGENAQYEPYISGGGVSPTIIAKGSNAVCYRLPSSERLQGDRKAVCGREEGCDTGDGR